MAKKAPKPKTPNSSKQFASSAVPPLAKPRISPESAHLLDIFAHAFRPVLASEGLSSLLQESKAALFDRDFARAFSRPELLEVYAARWGPTRALCYFRVLEQMAGRLGGDDEGTAGARDGSEAVAEHENRDANESGSEGRRLRVVALGGGVAELAALAALVARSPSFARADVALVDTAPWAGVLRQLSESMSATLPPTPYVPTPRPPLATPSTLSYAFAQTDMLALSPDELAAHLNGPPAASGSAPLLITLLFTLNELFTAHGVGQTTAFLLRLTRLVTPGTLLLVVDSPGSYAEVAVGQKARQYPMRWLLDHTLAEMVAESESAAEEASGTVCRWSKIDEQESVWYRLGTGRRYPIPLEDMRYQLHLYRADHPLPSSK